jgi:hypothetical protein
VILLYTAFLSLGVGRSAASEPLPSKFTACDLYIGMSKDDVYRKLRFLRKTTYYVGDHGTAVVADVLECPTSKCEVTVAWTGNNILKSIRCSRILWNGETYLRRGMRRDEIRRVLGTPRLSLKTLESYDSGRTSCNVYYNERLLVESFTIYAKPERS